MTAIDKSRFRNASGAILTSRLFLETNQGYANPEGVLYTLRREDYKGYPSLYRLYMALEDPLEFDFANTFFDSFEHWEQICATAWFQEYIYQWRKELDLKLRSRALRTIRDLSKDGVGNKAFEASKFLLTDGWNKGSKDEPKRGRPSKSDIKRAANEIASDSSLLREDLERLGIN